MGAIETYNNQLHQTEYRWFAIKTRPKAEKMLHGMFAKKQIEAYLPILQLVRRYTRKIKKVNLPLIPCYLFVKVTKNEYVSVLETDGVLGFVRFSKDLLAIPEREIDILRRITGEQIEVEVTPIEWKEGDEVEILQGNLAGIRGILVEKKGKHLVTVDLQHIGFSLKIDIDPKNLIKKAVFS